MVNETQFGRRRIDDRFRTGSYSERATNGKLRVIRDGVHCPHCHHDKAFKKESMHPSTPKIECSRCSGELSEEDITGDVRL